MQKTYLYVLTGFMVLCFMKSYVLSGSCTGSEFVGPNDVNDLSVLTPDSNDITTIVEVVSRGITSGAQVQVNTGDYVAIYHFNAATARYNTCDPVSTPSTCSKSVLYANDIPGSELNEGFTYTFTTLQSTVLDSSAARNYAAKAYLTTKSQVTCADETKAISDTLETGSHVTNVSTENMDVYSSGSAFSIESLNPVLPVTINTQTGQITTTGTLTPSYPDTSYDINIRVTDVCSQTNTCILTLVVTNDAKPIAFENLPNSVETVQPPDVTIVIFTVQLSRQRDVDDVDCVIQSYTPVHSDVIFTVQNVSNTAYNVLMTTSSSLEEFDLDTTILTVYCSSNQGYGNQSTLAVIFKHRNNNGGTFLVIGILLAVLVISTLIGTVAFLYKMKGKRSTNTPRRNTHRHVNPDVIPRPIFIEPARTTFSNINKPRGQHNRMKGRVSPSTSGYTSGFETSPNSSFGSETTPTSISPIEFVESPTEGNKRLIVNTKKTQTAFSCSTQSESNRFYFRKKPWKP